MESQEGKYQIVAEPEELEYCYQEFRERHAKMQMFLVKLEKGRLEASSGNNKLLDQLFEELAEIESQTQCCSLSFLSDLLNVLYQIVLRIKNDELQLNKRVVELFLMALDEMLIISKEAAYNRFADKDVISRVESSLIPMLTCRKHEVDHLVLQGVKQLLGGFVGTENSTEADQTEFFGSSKDQEISKHQDDTQVIGGEDGVDLFEESSLAEDACQSEADEVDDEDFFMEDRDMALFRTIADAIEFRNPIWRERDNSIMSIALGMNALGSNAVPFEQMEAAVYMRDFGMLRLPDKLFFEEDELDEEEQELLQSHPVSGYEVLTRLGEWEQAAKIVLQHQEREDGSGYPERLTGEWICPGAKILAICDTFFQLINNYHDPDSERAALRAVAEINSSKDVLFDAEWVERFNAVIKIQQRVIPPQDDS